MKTKTAGATIFTGGFVFTAPASPKRGKIHEKFLNH
jgi:hypothetical protein